MLTVSAAAAFGVWLPGREGGADAEPVANDAPVAVSPENLRDLAAAVGGAVYWAGPRRRTTYELTQTADGRTYVRYLPEGVAVGDPRPRFLTVATYRVEDAYAAVTGAGRQPGATTFRPRGGGIAVVHASRPGNVYLAHRGSDRQVEVFHPSPARARALVRANRITPVR